MYEYHQPLVRTPVCWTKQRHCAGWHGSLDSMKLLLPKVCCSAPMGFQGKLKNAQDFCLCKSVHKATKGNTASRACDPRSSVQPEKQQLPLPNLAVNVRICSHNVFRATCLLLKHHHLSAPPLQTLLTRYPPALKQPLVKWKTNNLLRQK